jgi:hypothetical protein
MAYLLHPSTLAASPTQGDGGANNTPAGSLLGVARSLLHGIRATLHGEPARAVADMRGAQSSSSSSSSSSTSTHQLMQGGRPNGALTSTASLFGEKRGGCAGGGVDNQGRHGAPPSTLPRPASISSTSSSALIQGRGSGAGTASCGLHNTRDADTMSDAELYRRAVDFADVEEVLRCPLPPVEGCPTPCAYGGHRRKGATPTTTTITTAASTPPLTFRCIGADPDTGISIYSAPVEDCPMHLMRAYAILPCAPRDVLQYMDNDVRPMWDTYIRRSAMLRELPPPETAAQAAATYQLSSSIGTAGAGVGHRSPTSLSARSSLQQAAPTAPSTVALPTTRSKCFSYQPGERRVAIHYLETRSPVPFVQDRDLELVVAEEVLPDGTAYSKALSTPFGYHMPLDPQQSRYVRAVVLLSGLVARPLEPAVVEQVLPPVLRRHRDTLLRKHTKQRGSSIGFPQGQPQQQPPPPPPSPPSYCVLEYVGLVHPMGLLPAVLVNIVISAQLNAIRKMQAFIAGHPMSTLRPRSAASLADGRPVLQATVPPLSELSAALQASPSESPATSSPHSAEEKGDKGSTPPPSTSSAGETFSSTVADQAAGTTLAVEPCRVQGGGAAEDRTSAQQRTATKSWRPWRTLPLLSRL